MSFAINPNSIKQTGPQQGAALPQQNAAMMEAKKAAAAADAAKVAQTMQKAGMQPQAPVAAPSMGRGRGGAPVINSPAPQMLPAQAPAAAPKTLASMGPVGDSNMTKPNMLAAAQGQMPAGDTFKSSAPSGMTLGSRLQGMGLGPKQGMKKGGSVKKMAKGGSVSSASKRADGCAQRGKTKGRMV